ncbi:DgyrCDS8012 [Dimorphilus gyrociliatus]|uniref:DgyrCDS8012 n=1 Tax=Dimorphilus gyrociliatus TaxID=2664684 RepID=A0A7I8VUK5_9ANNE|nr:DgyrCDS8012 [Dimorphilus gyrociliatus]
MNNKLCLLLISPLKEKSGNCTTIYRISEGLRRRNCICYVKDGSSFSSKENLIEFLNKNSISFILALHAFKSGKFLRNITFPYCIIFGGTDLLEGEKAFEVDEVIYQSKFCVAFTDFMKRKALKLWPNLDESSIHTIPQAVDATHDKFFDLKTYLNKVKSIQVNKDSKIFLIVGGVRRIKDQTFIVNSFDELRNEYPECLLVILGPIIEEQYRKEFKDCLRCKDYVIHVEGFTNEETKSAIKQSFALVNTSKSEGMASAILEAFALGTPVLARNIDSNRYLLRMNNNNDSGLLYDTPHEFVECARLLIREDKLRDRIVACARSQIKIFHMQDDEALSYIDYLQSYM